MKNVNNDPFFDKTLPFTPDPNYAPYSIKPGVSQFNAGLRYGTTKFLKSQKSMKNKPLHFGINFTNATLQKHTKIDIG